MEKKQTNRIDTVQEFYFRTKLVHERNFLQELSTMIVPCLVTGAYGLAEPGGQLYITDGGQKLFPVPNDLRIRLNEFIKDRIDCINYELQYMYNFDDKKSEKIE